MPQVSPFFPLDLFSLLPPSIQVSRAGKIQIPSSFPLLSTSSHAQALFIPVQYHRDSCTSFSQFLLFNISEIPAPHSHNFSSLLIDWVPIIHFHTGTQDPTYRSLSGSLTENKTKTSLNTKVYKDLHDLWFTSLHQRISVLSLTLNSSHS